LPLIDVFTVLYGQRINQTLYLPVEGIGTCADVATGCTTTYFYTVNRKKVAIHL